METLLMVFYALHVLFGVAWFGGAIFSLAVVGPAFAGLSRSAIAEAGPRLGLYAGKMMPAAATGTIVLGVCTAYATGRLDNVTSFILTPYGQTAVAAFLVAVGTYFWGHGVIAARVRRVQQAPPEEQAQAVKLMMHAVGIEQAGFLAILSCMVLMRFGY